MNRKNVIATAGYMPAESVEYVISQWKFSNEEAYALRMLVEHRDIDFRLSLEDSVYRINAGWETLEDTLLKAEFEKNWEVYKALESMDWPKFPVNGNDLIAAGMKPGPELGRVLTSLRNRWAVMPQATKEDMMQVFEASRPDQSQ